MRSKEPVILAVDTRKARDGGLVILRAGKTVFLVDRVPAEYLSPAEAPAAPAPSDGDA